jgi:hypothetical protein
MSENEPEVVKKRKRIIDQDSEPEPDGETAEPQIAETTNNDITVLPEVPKDQPYEPPGPRSTKKSAQILKEIEVRTILQSAVIISADGSEAQSRKKKIRVLEDSDEEKEETGKVDIDDIGKAEEENVVKEEPVESEDAVIVIADRLEEVEQTENGVEPDGNDAEKNGTELSDEVDENNSEQEMEEGGEKSDQEVDEDEQSEAEPDQMEQGSENEELEGSKENDDEAATDNENAENAVEEPLQNGNASESSTENQECSENETNDEEQEDEEQEDEEEVNQSDASERNKGERESEERVYEKPGPRSTKKRPELCEEKRYEPPGPKCTKKNPEIASDHEDDNLPVDQESEDGEENQSDNSQPNDENGDEENGGNTDSDDDSTLETEPEPEVVIQATRFTVYSGIPDPLNQPRRMSPNSRRRHDRR